MISETIKTMLGDELTAQVEKALEGKGKNGGAVDLVVGNDGSYVPAEKFDAEKNRATNAEKVLQSAADAMKAAGGSGDPTKIADDVKLAQAKITELQAGHSAEIARLNKVAGLRQHLSGIVHDPDDIISLIELDEVEIDEAGNLKTDFDKLIEPIKTGKSYLFKEAEAPPEIKGAVPARPGAPAKPNAPATPVVF